MQLQRVSNKSADCPPNGKSRYYQLVEKEKMGSLQSFCREKSREETRMDDTTLSIDTLSELFYKNPLETEDSGLHPTLLLAEISHIKGPT